MVFQEYLENLNACSEACEWAGDRTARQAWDECERPDWLLWWAGAVKIDRKKLVRCACLCARTALQFVPAGELRPLQAIEAAESWIEGRATLQEVRKAAYAANAANAAYAYAYAAANAAANAADAAYAAANAAAAAYAAANAANAAKQEARLNMCRIIREIITFEEVYQEGK